MVARKPRVRGIEKCIFSFCRYGCVIGDDVVLCGEKDNIWAS